MQRFPRNRRTQGVPQRHQDQRRSVSTDSYLQTFSAIPSNPLPVSHAVMLLSISSFSPFFASTERPSFPSLPRAHTRTHQGTTYAARGTDDLARFSLIVHAALASRARSGPPPGLPPSRLRRTSLPLPSPTPSLLPLLSSAVARELVCTRSPSLVPSPPCQSAARTASLMSPCPTASTRVSPRCTFSPSSTRCP